MFLPSVFLALVVAQMEEKTNVTFVEGKIYKTKLIFVLSFVPQAPRLSGRSPARRTPTVPSTGAASESIHSALLLLSVTATLRSSTVQRGQFCLSRIRGEETWYYLPPSLSSNDCSVSWPAPQTRTVSQTRSVMRRATVWRTSTRPLWAPRANMCPPSAVSGQAEHWTVLLREKLPLVTAPWSAVVTPPVTAGEGGALTRNLSVWSQSVTGDTGGEINHFHYFIFSLL